MHLKPQKHMIIYLLFLLCCR